MYKRCYLLQKIKDYIHEKKKASFLYSGHIYLHCYICGIVTKNLINTLKSSVVANWKTKQEITQLTQYIS